jgi:nitroreductase
MELNDAIQKRYSCREYQNKPIDKKKINKILESARLAPSAKNIQDWRFIVVTDPTTKQQLAKAAAEQMFIADASAIIVACSASQHVMRCGHRIGPIDVAIALEHIALAATAAGLATCWIGAFYPDQVRKVIAIPEDIQIIELMPIGYPADQPRAKKREPLENILCYEAWGF